jgi:NAD(P)-dependent dehydrogenase (short-subunit alcohol dehydrogenase family)
LKEGERLEKELGDQYGSGKVAFKRVDITSHTNFEAAFEKCLDHFDGLDVVVNVAGVDGEINWESQLQINFYVCTLSFLLS